MFVINIHHIHLYDKVLSTGKNKIHMHHLPYEHTMQHHQTSMIVVIYSHNDVVDGNVDELNEKSDETHDGESDGSGKGDLLEL